MPLKKGSSKTAMRANIKRLIKEDKAQNVAIAIAYSKAGKSKSRKK